MCTWLYISSFSAVEGEHCHISTENDPNVRWCIVSISDGRSAHAEGKIIKSQPLIKHKESNHTVWETPSAEHEGNNSQKKWWEIMSKNVFVLISLSGVCTMLATAWHFPHSHQSRHTVQWPEDGSCFPPLEWQIWPVRQKGSLIRLFVHRDGEIPSSIYQRQSHSGHTEIKNTFGDL